MATKAANLQPSTHEAARASVDLLRHLISGVGESIGLPALARSSGRKPGDRSTPPWTTPRFRYDDKTGRRVPVPAQ
jgi:hypothetical protein